MTIAFPHLCLVRDWISRFLYSFFWGGVAKRWCANVVFSHGKVGEIVVICMATTSKRFSGLEVRRMEA